MNHDHYMNRALDLAAKGIGTVSPNPAVGAVLVKNGQIIGEGYHRGPGGKHAEIDAIENAEAPVEGSVLYTTLEPCCTLYEGKRNPPCADRIIAEGISHVVIASEDPDVHVRGGGIEKLRNAGIKVTSGIGDEQSRRLNEAYNTNRREQRPFIHLKTAQTLDGRIATAGGDSKWITDRDARAEVHRLRYRYDAILIGSETARMDDPELTVRLDDRGKGLHRLVLNSALDLPLSLKLFSDQKRNPTTIVTVPGHDGNLRQSYLDLGVSLLEMEGDQKGRIPLDRLTGILYGRGISSLFVEGGSSVLTSFLKMGLFDRISFFIAPRICGEGINSVGDLHSEKMADALDFEKVEIEIINDQTVYHAWRKACLRD